jgi:hypothetical protein
MNHAILSCCGKASERFCMKWTDMRPGREQTSGLLELEGSIAPMARAGGGQRCDADGVSRGAERRAKAADPTATPAASIFGARWAIL